MRAVIFPLIVCALAACQAPAPEATAPAPPAAASLPVTSAEVSSAPAADVGSLHVDLPAEGTLSFVGFGPAKFGDGAEQLRMAWGGDLGDAQPAEPGGCYYLIPATQPKPDYKIGFMIEGDRFVRIDVSSSRIEAPGGGRVGMDEAALRKLYGAALQSMPHKYVEGAHYLTVAATDGAPGKLVFETDAQGKVTTWRIGLSPQVDYVEGCG